MSRTTQSSSKRKRSSPEPSVKEKIIHDVLYNIDLLNLICLNFRIYEICKGIIPLSKFFNKCFEENEKTLFVTKQCIKYDYGNVFGVKFVSDLMKKKSTCFDKSTKLIQFFYRDFCDLYKNAKQEDNDDFLKLRICCDLFFWSNYTLIVSFELLD